MLADVSYSDEDQWLRRTIRVVPLTFLLLIVGCPLGDRSMTIRQAVQHELRGAPAIPSPSNLTIAVRTSHSFIGSTVYTPDITATNSSASPLTINAIELTAKGVVYANLRQEEYPVVVASGRTQALGIGFKLRDDVWNTFFKQPADLQVTYVINGYEMTGHVSIIGDRLNSKVQ
jgi:hypothetical protein